MDFVTRQFIVLAKKLRADVRKALTIFQNGLEKIGDQIEAATSAYKAKNDKNPTSPVLNAVLHRSQSEIDNEDARATRHEERDRNRLRLETLGVVVGAIVAFATLGQLMLTKRAVNIAAISANAAQESAMASKKSVDATQKSIEVTAANFQLDQRAWIGIVKEDTSPTRKPESGEF